MEFVTNDGNGAWQYAGAGVYWFIGQSGKQEGRLKAEFLSNPDALWRSKLKKAGLELKDPKAIDYKPSEVVYKLWEHRNANANS